MPTTLLFFFFQAEDGIRDKLVTGVQTCALPISLGASASALRRTLLAESLLLCGAGAILGVLIARPMVSVLARYASRFSVRALDLTVDASLLWVGVGLAVTAAIVLAFVPRLPASDASNGMGVTSGG